MRISSSQTRKKKKRTKQTLEVEKDMGMMKIIMVTMMMTLLVGTIRETKATSAAYAACVKHCNDLCSPKVGDRNCVPNCIFFTCGPPLPKKYSSSQGKYTFIINFFLHVLYVYCVNFYLIVYSNF